MSPCSTASRNVASVPVTSRTAIFRDSESLSDFPESSPQLRRQVHESEVPRILRRGLKCHHVQCQQYLLVFQDGKSFPSKLMAQLI